MKAVMDVTKEAGLPRSRRHQEKFVSLGGNPFGDIEELQAVEAEIALAESDDDGPADVFADAPGGPVKLEVELDGEEYTFDDWDPRTKMLDFLESKGVKAPYSCREGECSACAIRLIEGDVKMIYNDVLDKDDLEDGIRLGCQSVPLTDTVKVSYS
jgi:3-ketosteroid 9alpha-monooxygenase subunit B